jgi:hypothetical protein
MKIPSNNPTRSDQPAKNPTAIDRLRGLPPVFIVLGLMTTCFLLATLAVGFSIVALELVNRPYAANRGA